MRFWDSSALVPLLLGEPKTASVRELLEADDRVVAFWASDAECVSAVARREREGLLDSRHVALALERLTALSAGWSEVCPIEAVRERARRLLRVHPLRATDSFQLAAALVACEESPPSLPFVCLDSRLRTAAGREGFTVLPAEP